MNKFKSQLYTDLSTRFKYSYPLGKEKSQYLERIWIYSDGRIEFFNENGRLKFENIFDKLNQEETNPIHIKK